MQFNKK
jgi:hypothetical protein